MNTRYIPQPYRKRMKRAQRKIACAFRRTGDFDSLPAQIAIIELNKARGAGRRLEARIAKAAARLTPDVESPEGWQDRVHAEAKRKGLIT